jgi:hypothetical protein
MTKIHQSAKMKMKAQQNTNKNSFFKIIRIVIFKLIVVGKIDVLLCFDVRLVVPSATRNFNS